jgi:predicted Zn-dependent peptidase
MKNIENIVKTYPCGLRMIVRPMPNFKSVATSVYVGVGSRNEAENEFGLSHFVEHMLFKGTKTRTAEMIAQTLSNLGVQYNAFTSNTATCYHTKGLITNLAECNEVLADMYFNLKFPEDDFHREAEVIVQEIVMCDDQPRHALSDLCSETFFAGTGYEHPIAGSKKSVRAFKPEDIYAYIAKHYTAPRTIISFAGDITVEQAEMVVKKYWLSKFGKTSQKPAEIVKPTTAICPPKVQNKRKKKIGHHYVAVMFPAVTHFNTDKYALSFVDGIFSQDMSSRLFLAVREKLGLVYNIRGGVDLADIGGFYYIRFSCTPQNTQKVLDVIKSEIAILLEKGVTDDEIAKIKNIKRSNRLFKCEDVEDMNQMIVSMLDELGEIETTDAYLTRIEKMTRDEVNAAARKYLDISKASVCVLGSKIKPISF